MQDGLLASWIRVEISAHDRGDPSEEKVIIIPVESYIVNNCFSLGVHQNYGADVAVIFLASDVSSSITDPVTLYDPSSTIDFVPGSEDVTIVGWGDTIGIDGYTANFPEKVQYVTLPSITNTLCKEFYGAQVTDEMVCAYEEGGGKDSCQGDSGGPLLFYPGGGTNGTAYQVGVTSWGVGCADENKPGVYVNLGNSDIFDWVFGAINGIDVNAKQTICANQDVQGCFNFACNRTTCMDGVYARDELGNGQCNEALNCTLYLNDLGDCLDSSLALDGCIDYIPHDAPTSTPF